MDRAGNAKWLEGIIREFINSPANSLQNEARERAWEDPLVGFSSGDDLLYTEFKEHVGPFHWTPREIFSLTYPGSEIASEQLTVISWVLPQTSETKKNNVREKVFPAERWVRARMFGEMTNDGLRRHVVAALGEKGFRAVAPCLSPEWGMRPSERFTFSSNWSERHAAYASGLGTFGLCRGLITPKGKAMRVGSVVAEIPIAPTTRQYTDHRQWCLFYVDGSCRECAKRCPVGAISDEGTDKLKCREHSIVKAADFVSSSYGFEGYGCGLCQTGVPCESRVPLKLKKSG
jgi:epoxyqueuosine reductase QueG